MLSKDTKEWYAIQMAFVLAKVNLLSGYYSDEDGVHTLRAGKSAILFAYDIKDWAVKQEPVIQHIKAVFKVDTNEMD